MKNSRPKLFITGVSGFIGSSLARYFNERGFEVSGSGTKERPSFGLQTVLSRYLKWKLGEPVPKEMFTEVDLVVHAAFLKGPGNEEINISGSRAAMEAASRAGVPSQIFISSISAISGSSDYARSKRELEQVAKSLGAAVVRPGLVIGEGGLYSRMVTFVRRVPVIPLIGQGEQAVYGIEVNALCAAIFQIATDGQAKNEWNLYENQHATLRQLLEVIAKERGLHRFFLSVPLVFVRWSLMVIERMPFVRFPFDRNNLLGLLENSRGLAKNDLPEVLSSRDEVKK